MSFDSKKEKLSKALAFYSDYELIDNVLRLSYRIRDIIVFFLENFILKKININKEKSYFLFNVN